MDDEKKEKKIVAKKTTKTAATKKSTSAVKSKTVKLAPKRAISKKVVTEEKNLIPVEHVEELKKDIVETKIDTNEVKVVAKPRKTTINIKNKKEATKVLSKTKAQSPRTKKVAIKKTEKKDPLKNVNILEKDETLKEETKKKEVKVKKKDVKKTSKQKEEKTKLVLPKEWTVVNNKKKTSKTRKEFTNTNTLTNVFKRSIFEEVDESAYQEEKKIKNAKRKKHLLIFLIVTIILIVTGLILVKYNDFVKKQLAVYDVYHIGDKVKLNDDSIWYVVEDSDAHNDTIKLLKETVIDITGDNVITEKDKMKYNMDDKPEYDIESNGSGPYYLTNTYKPNLEKKVGHIESISMLETKEFVKIRQRLEFGDEWNEGNWLASSSLGNWWIISEQNQKVFAVSPNGSFKLYYAKSYNYVRPTIVIKKDLIKVENEELPNNEQIENGEKKD